MTVYVSLPLTGPRAAEGKDAADGARLALEQAGGQGGRPRGRGRVPRRRQGQAVGPGRGRRERARGGPGLEHRRLHRRARLGADARLAADHQRGRHRPGLARRRRGRPDPAGRGLPGLARSLPALRRADLRPRGPRRRRARRAPRPSAAVELELRATSASLATDSPFDELMAAEFERRRRRGGDRGASGRRDAASHVRAPATEGVAPRSPDREYLIAGSARPVEARPAGASPPTSRRAFGRPPGPYAAYGYEAMDAGRWRRSRRPRTPATTSAARSSTRCSRRSARTRSLGRYSITEDGDSTLCAVQPYALERQQRIPASRSARADRAQLTASSRAR